MRILGIFFVLWMSIYSCMAQDKSSLEVSIITKFVDDNKEFEEPYLKGGVLYLFGYGENFLVGNIEVIFLNLEEVKEKVRKTGEFEIVEMGKIIKSDNIFKVSFIRLKAKNNSKINFTISDNFNSDYCVIFNCNTNNFDILWCGEKYE